MRPCPDRTFRRRIFKTLYPRTRRQNRYVYAVRARRSQPESRSASILDPAADVHKLRLRLLRGHRSPGDRKARPADDRRRSREGARRGACDHRRSPVLRSRSRARHLLRGDGEPSTFGAFPLVDALTNWDAWGFRTRRSSSSRTAAASTATKCSRRTTSSWSGAVRSGSSWMQAPKSSTGRSASDGRAAMTASSRIRRARGGTRSHVQSMFLRWKALMPAAVEACVGALAPRCRGSRGAGSLSPQQASRSRETIEPHLRADGQGAEDIAAASGGCAGVPVETFPENHRGQPRPISRGLSRRVRRRC